MLASVSYPLLAVFLMLLFLVGMFLYLWLVIAVFTDIVRSPDLSGLAKAGWTLVALVPLVGVVIYLIVHGDQMQQHPRRVDAS